MNPVSKSGVQGREGEPVRLGLLAELVGGEVIGDPALEIRGVQPFEAAGSGEITLAEDRKFRERLDQTRASAVIVPPGAAVGGKSAIEVEHPRVAFARIAAHFHDVPFRAVGISSRASVGEGCRIKDNVTIESFACVGDRVEIGEGVTICSGVVVGDDCVIGEGSTLFPNATLYSGTVLGERVAIHAGTVIGADGFGYATDGERRIKIPQTGRVEIGDDVEIGANSAVDRATFGATVIGRGVKIDNLVHIGHNCRIGDHTVITGCVGISGSVTIGRRCILAGQSGVVDHVTLGDDVVVLSKTQVDKDIPSGRVVSGMPARDHRQELKTLALVHKLPELFGRLRDLERRLKE